MTVGMFVDELLRLYNRDDELYFTTSASDNEHIFDNVLIQPKDEDFDETDVYLTFNKEHEKEFRTEFIDEWAEEFRDRLISVVDEYL